MHIRLGVIAAANSGLVGDDEERDARVHEPPQRGAGTGDDFQFVGVVEVMGISPASPMIFKVKPDTE